MYSQYYNTFYREIAKIDAMFNTFEKIKDILPELKGNETIIDIGCGYGTVTEHLVKRGFRVVGVEINDEAIEQLKSKGFEVLKRDVNQPLNIDEKFDIVLLLDILEHVFDPLNLLLEARKICKDDGYIIAIIPLYFDILDRIKILFTGKIISLDILSYGEEIYKKFRSYNYAHIRFFRPEEVFEMGNQVGLKADKAIYVPTFYAGKNIIIRLLTRIISNKYTVKLRPTLIAHSMKIRWRLK